MKKQFAIVFVVLLSFFVFGSGFVFGQDTTTVTWQHGPNFGKDALIADGGFIHKNFGTGITFNAIGGSSNHRGLIQFDSLQYVDSDAIIIYAELILTSRGTGSHYSGDSTASLYRVTKQWTEGTKSNGFGVVNWDSASTSVKWSSSGGDTDTIAYGTRAVGALPSDGDTVIYNVTDLVQGWTRGTWNNYGMLLRLTQTSMAEDISLNYYSSDVSTASKRPKLVVSYFIPKGTITGTVVDSLSNSPLNDVIVVVSPGNLTDSTDSNGNFSLSDIPLGEYAVTFTKDSYKIKSISSISILSDTLINLGSIPLILPDSIASIIHIDFNDGATIKNLQFGFHPEGNDGIDTIFSETELPPTPISGAFFDARFTGDSLGNGSRIDIRNTNFDSLFFFVDINRISLSDDITVTWDSIANVGQKFTLLEMNGPIAVTTVNMLSTTSHAVSDSIETLKIVVGPGAFTTWDINYAAEWNLVSLGGIPLQNSLGFLFPTADSPAYTFNTSTQSYETVTTLTEGNGYWVNFLIAANSSKIVEVVDSLNQTLSTGWNMIGTVSNPVAIGDISDPAGAIISIYKNLAGTGYSLVTDSLRRGEGYWVNSSANATIDIVSQGLSKRGGLYYLNDPATETNRLFDLRVSTDYGAQTLPIHIGNEPGNSNYRYALPPPAPFERMTARFNIETERIYGMGKLYITEEKALDGSITVGVPNDNSTLKFRWNNSSLEKGHFFLKDGLDGHVFGDVDMAEQNELSLDGAKLNTVLFSYAGRNPVIQDFALEPNYPNPFNPSTNIVYTIKDAGPVKLAIYNILGQEVRKLVHRVHDPGSFTVTWDGRDNFGKHVAGGVYIYRLEAKNFTFSRKLLLIK